MYYFNMNLDLLDRLRSNEIWNRIRSRDLIIIPLLISGLWKRARSFKTRSNPGLLRCDIKSEFISVFMRSRDQFLPQS